MPINLVLGRAAMRGMGLGILIGAVVFAALGVTAIVVAPTEFFQWAENTPAKVILSTFTLSIIASVGWSIYRHYHIPSIKRYIITMGGFVVSACIGGGMFPLASSQLFDAINFHYQAGAEPAKVQIPKPPQVLVAKLSRSQMGYPEAITIVGGAFFGVVACILCIASYATISIYEHQYGVTLT
jgi:hypothetical protein